MENQGASVVISHYIKEGKQNQYEQWLNEIGPVCRSFAGNIDWQIIRPIANLTYTYTIIIRFDTIDNLSKWMESPQRVMLIDMAKPFFEDDKYIIRSGLDFLFDDQAEKQKAPPKWKQYLVTWSAIYPLSLLIPMIVIPTLQTVHFPESKFVTALFVSGIVVYIMVYWLMPNYTKLIKKWLYK